jgi:hypothetical protein
LQPFKEKTATPVCQGTEKEIKPAAWKMEILHQDSVFVSTNKLRNRLKAGI